MSWSNRYLPGSFRGVDFHLTRANVSGGRLTTDHQFPRRDETETEDLGGLPKKITLNIFLLGTDYILQAENLEEALNQGGIGVLVHPHRGVFNAKVVGGFSGVESGDEGGMIRYSVTFSIESSISLIVVDTDTRWIARQRKDDFISAAKDNFFSIFDLAQKPANVIRDARSAMDQGLSVIDSAKRIAASAADFKRQIENTRGRLTAIMLNLEYLVDSFVDLADWGLDEVTGENTREQYRELSQISKFVSAVIGEVADQPSTYPARQVQLLIGYAATAVQVGLIPDVDFLSLADAEGVQSDLFKNLDAFMLDDSISDDLYAAMRDAKAAAYNDIDGRVLTLPRFVDHELSNTDNTLSLMWELYGDLSREQAFIDRNEIVHPGFLPTGVTLKVQTDA